MSLWSTTLRISADMKLVTSPESDDLIKARLPLEAPHPRALLTMLEGIALFSGVAPCTVVSAGTHREHWLDSEQGCNDLSPAERPLVHSDLALPPPRARRRLRGVGDFREVRQQLRLVWPR